MRNAHVHPIFRDLLNSMTPIVPDARQQGGDAMSETKFDLGPWEVETPLRVVRNLGPGYVRIIATGLGPDLECNRANAHLIAAAPDLYAALRDIVETTYARPDIVVSFDEAQQLERARAALAKARGETP